MFYCFQCFNQLSGALKFEAQILSLRQSFQLTKQVEYQREMAEDFTSLSVTKFCNLISKHIETGMQLLKRTVLIGPEPFVFLT